MSKYIYLNIMHISVPSFSFFSSSSSFPFEFNKSSFICIISEANRERRRILIVDDFYEESCIFTHTHTVNADYGTCCCCRLSDLCVKILYKYFEYAERKKKSFLSSSLTYCCLLLLPILLLFLLSAIIK